MSGMENLLEDLFLILMLLLGSINSEEIEDFAKIHSILELSREKYAVHFEGDEANVIRDQNGDFVGSSIPLNFKGTFDVNEKSFLDHFIARHSVDTHFCLIPGCSDHSSKP